MHNKVKFIFLKSIIFLSPFPNLAQSQDNVYEISAYGEFRYSPFTIHESNPDWQWRNVTLGFAYTKNVGLSLSKYFGNGMLGVGFSHNSSYLYFDVLKSGGHNSISSGQIEFKDLRIVINYCKPILNNFSLSVGPGCTQVSISYRDF